MNLHSFSTELKRHPVYTVAATYIVTSWLLIQIATQVSPFFAVPGWIVRLIIWLLIVGFPVACAWTFAITPEGIKREEEICRRRFRARRIGRKLAAIVVTLATAAIALTIFRHLRTEQTEEKNPPTIRPTEFAGKSIAVLPFENLGEDKTNAYFVSGMPDEILTALAQLRTLNVRSRISADKIDPHFFYDVDPLANVFCAEGRWQDAIKRYDSLPSALLARPNFQLAICYAHAGERDRAHRVLADLEAISHHRYIDHVHLAGIHAALGDKDKAFAALAQACEERSARVSTPRFYPWLSPLFDDPRFAALEENVAHSAISSE